MESLTAVRLAARAAVDVVTSDLVAQMWTRPSVLDGYRVGGLAAHLVRAIQTIRTYAEGPPPDGGEHVDAAGYFAAVLGTHDPHSSERHAGVRARGEGQVEAGPSALVDSAAHALTWLEAWQPEPGRLFAVLDGTVVAVEDYLDTRLVELLIHTDDLAASLGLPPVALPDDLWNRVVPVLADTAVLRHSGREVALYLARPERARRAGSFDASGPEL